MIIAAVSLIWTTLKTWKLLRHSFQCLCTRLDWTNTFAEPYQLVKKVSIKLCHHKEKRGSMEISIWDPAQSITSSHREFIEQNQWQQQVRSWTSPGSWTLVSRIWATAQKWDYSNDVSWHTTAGVFAGVFSIFYIIFISHLARRLHARC